MKMKSRLFGLNAKVALAILAFSSVTLTSCYESEKDDVILPFKPNPAAYTITGEITDIASGARLDGVKLAFTGAETFDVTTSGGSYSVTKEKAGDYTITISKTGYQTKTCNITIAALKDGQGSTYFLNAGLYPDPFDVNKMEVDVAYPAKYGTNKKVFESKDIPQVDWVNNSSSSLFISLKISTDIGERFEDNKIDAASISDDFKAGIKQYLTGVYSKLPEAYNAQFRTGASYYEFHLAPLHSLKSISATTVYYKHTYTFRYGEESLKLAVITVNNIEFNNAQQSNSHGHGKGHGHGHGDDLNAGGGIITGIN